MENKKRDDTANLTAERHGVTASYVRMVVNGSRKNESILNTYNEILQTKKRLSAPVETAA